MVSSHAVARLAMVLDAPVTVVQPMSPMIIDRDVAVVSRDGQVGGEQFPSDSSRAGVLIDG